MSNKQINFKFQISNFKFLIIGLFVICLFAYLLIPRFARAQTQIFTAIPPRLEVKVKPGEFVQKTIQFRNEGDETAYLAVVAKDFIVKDTAGTPEFVGAQVSGRWAASSWIRLSPTSVAVAPKQTVNIVVSANVPLDALPGGHYAGVLYQSKGTPPRIGAGTGAGTAIQQVVGTLVYFTVEGPVTERALVKLFDAPKFLEFGPVKFTTEILNLSDLHLAPKGTITVRNMLGKVTTVMPLEERNIFPSASFIYQNTWNAKYLLGRYRADLSASYGTTGQVLLATLYFVVFPVRIALAIVLAIVIAILIVLFLRRRQKEKEELEEETPKEKTT
ncbi:MAG: hypothetical protein ACOZBZ_04620 [Patescibacteria group bacterium]